MVKDSFVDVTEKLHSVDLSADSHNASDEGEHEEEQSDEEDEDDDDGGGWITPSNLKQVQMQAGNCGPSADVKVGCLTTDFAMQVQTG